MTNTFRLMHRYDLTNERNLINVKHLIIDIFSIYDVSLQTIKSFFNQLKSIESIVIYITDDEYKQKYIEQFLSIILTNINSLKSVKTIDIYGGYDEYAYYVPEAHSIQSIKTYGFKII